MPGRYYARFSSCFPLASASARAPMKIYNRACGWIVDARPLQNDLEITGELALGNSEGFHSSCLLTG